MTTPNTHMGEFAMEGVTDKCKTCGGSGKENEESIYAPEHYTGIPIDCPDCKGTGNAVTKDKEGM